MNQKVRELLRDRQMEIHISGAGQGISYELEMGVTELLVAKAADIHAKTLDAHHDGMEIETVIVSTVTEPITGAEASTEIRMGE